MTATDILISVELLDLELRNGLPADERAWTKAKIAELQTQLEAMEEGA